MFVAFKQTHLGKRIIDLEVSILRLRVSRGNFTRFHSPTSPEKSWVSGLGTPNKMVIFLLFFYQKNERKKETPFLLGSLVCCFVFWGVGVVTFFLDGTISATKVTTSDGWWNVSSEINMDGIQMSGFR